MKKSALLWLVLGWIGYALLPWYLEGELGTGGALAQAVAANGGCCPW
jgi:hypothetical protein